MAVDSNGHISCYVNKITSHYPSGCGPLDYIWTHDSEGSQNSPKRQTVENGVENEINDSFTGKKMEQNVFGNIVFLLSGVKSHPTRRCKFL